MKNNLLLKCIYSRPKITTIIKTLQIVRFQNYASSGNDKSGIKNFDSRGTDSKIHGKVVPKIKTSMIYDQSVKSIKFITPVRTMKEFMLTSKDLENIPNYYSRSPYSYETRMLVYRRSDVEELAYSKYGSKEKFEKLIGIRKEVERKQRAEIFVRKQLNFFNREDKGGGEEKLSSSSNDNSKSFSKGAGKVVIYAIIINGTNFIVKLVAWWHTGSKSMFAEAMHSLADTMNQVIIAYGIHSSLQKPDDIHPYGYIPMKNITSLISGVGIFCLGAGISFYHAINGIITGSELSVFPYFIHILLGSFISESITFTMAINHAIATAKKDNFTLKEYLMEGIDPAINVILLEDFAALLGVGIAFGSIGLSYLLNSSIPDSIGSLMVSGLIASVAYVIVHTNTETLIGRSIAPHKKEAIMKIIDREKIVRGTYDIKATSLGGDTIKFKAEIDIDGRELTKRYIETIPLDTVLKECQSIAKKEELIEFMLNHGEKIVNILGAEVNRIEGNIKKEFPSVKHIDIEVN